MKRRILEFMMITCCMAVSFLSLTACGNELDILQEYPFTVESMPVAGEITDGETVEIRLEIKPGREFHRDGLYAEVFSTGWQGQV